MNTQPHTYLASAIDVVNVAILGINGPIVPHRVAGKGLEVVDGEVKLTFQGCSRTFTACLTHTTRHLKEVIL